jgi:hypothetical protein
MKRIENLPGNELKVIIVFTGSKHTEAYEDLFNIVNTTKPEHCKFKNIGIILPSSKDKDEC